MMKSIDTYINESFRLRDDTIIRNTLKFNKLRKLIRLNSDEQMNDCDDFLDKNIKIIQDTDYQFNSKETFNTMMKMVGQYNEGLHKFEHDNLIKIFEVLSDDKFFVHNVCDNIVKDFNEFCRDTKCWAKQLISDDYFISAWLNKKWIVFLDGLKQANRFIFVNYSND